jgi:hypothetical protein
MTSTKTAPVVHKITRTTGNAGQFAYTVRVTHTSDDGYSDTSETTFVGSECGNPGPVVLITASGMQDYVTDPDRFGPKLTPEWIRNYYGQA